jgi:hypothetical protein
MKPSMSRALVAGFVGTVALSLIAYTGYPLLAQGAPLDLAGMLSGAFEDRWLAGLIGLFAIGTLILPALYVGMFHHVLPRTKVAGGLAWGLVVWLLALTALAAATHGEVLRWAAGGAEMILGILIGMLAYGVVFGAVLNTGRRMRSPEERLHEPEDLRQAS